MRRLNFEKLKINIQNWIIEYARSAKANGIVVGMSGGIDSSVIAALSVNALGKENVIGVGLPCESHFNDLEDARMVADNLGIAFEVIDLTEIYNKFINSISGIFSGNKLARANVKPRLRMITLYYIAQSLENYLVAGTGNRAELAIGYFTKYGDGGVDIEPIGNLYKSEVRKLARVLNIPEKIIKKPPSPGLWPGQTDEGEIGLTYDLIDEILYRIDNNLDLSDLDERDVQKVKKMMKKAQHKLEMPPSYKIGENDLL